MNEVPCILAFLLQGEREIGTAGKLLLLGMEDGSFDALDIYNRKKVLKIWSSHLLDNLSNCLMNLKNSGDSTGFEPMTSAMPVQCSNQLSYEVTQLRAGQFVGLMFSRERNVVWKKC